MNQNIKEKWLTALRTGTYVPNKNGNFREHPSFTKRSVRHCPYGILCEIFQQETGIGTWKIINDENGQYYDFITTIWDVSRIKPSGNGEWVFHHIVNEDLERQPRLIIDILVWAGITRMFSKYCVLPSNKSSIVTTSQNQKFRGKDVKIWYKPIKWKGHSYWQITDIYDITHDYKLFADLIEEQF